MYCILLYCLYFMIFCIFVYCLSGLCYALSSNREYILSVHTNCFQTISILYKVHMLMSVCLSIHPSIHLSMHPSIYLSMHLSIYTCIHPSIHASIHLSIHPSILYNQSTCHSHTLEILWSEILGSKYVKFLLKSVTHTHILLIEFTFYYC